MATRVTGDVLEDQRGIAELFSNFSERMQKFQRSEKLDGKGRMHCQRIMDVVSRVATCYMERGRPSTPEAGFNKTCLDQLRYTMGLLPSRKKKEQQLTAEGLKNLYESAEFLRSLFGNGDRALGAPLHQREGHLPSVHSHFIDRKELFAAITTTFSEYNTVVLHGPPGIGKTETAIAFGNRNRDTFPFVWMIHAETVDQIEQSYRKLSEALNVQILKEDNLKAMEKKVFTKLKESDVPWLLIYDNVKDLIHFPQGGKVLITTNFADRFSKYRDSAIPVPFFEDQEALSLMAKVTEEQPEELRDLVERVGHYPLVIGQVAQSMRMEPEETRAAVEALTGEDDQKMHEVLKAVLGQQLIKLPPLALEWLHVCSHLNPENMPVSFIEIWLQTQHGMSIRESQQQAKQIVSILVNRGWLRMDHSTETFSIHRLFQVILKDEGDESSYGQACNLLIKLWEEIDYKNFRNWKNEFSLGEEFCSHTVLLLNDSRFETIPKEDQAKLYSRAGKFEYLQGKYEEALKKLEQAFEIRKNFLETPLVIAMSLLNVGNCLYALGRNEEALEKYNKALMFQQKSLERPTHLEIAETHQFIGNCLYRLGQYDEALVRYKEALKIRDKSLDANHPANAPILSSIGNCLYCQGKYKDAVKKYKKAEDIWMRESWDLNQLAIAENQRLIGDCWYFRRNYKKALKHHQEAFKTWQESWEADPRLIARALNNVGKCLEAQGKKVKESNWEAYEQAKASFVEDHPDKQSYLKEFNRTKEKTR